MWTWLCHPGPNVCISRTFSVAGSAPLRAEGRKRNSARSGSRRPVVGHNKVRTIREPSPYAGRFLVYPRRLKGSNRLHVSQNSSVEVRALNSRGGQFGAFKLYSSDDGQSRVCSTTTAAAAAAAAATAGEARRGESAAGSQPQELPPIDGADLAANLERSDCCSWCVILLSDGNLLDRLVAQTPRPTLFAPAQVKKRTRARIHGPPGCFQ